MLFQKFILFLKYNKENQRKLTKLCDNIKNSLGQNYEVKIPTISEFKIFLSLLLHKGTIKYLRV